MTSSKTGRYRWVVVALLFFATSINYLDRQVIGLLKPTLDKTFNWDERDYGHIVMAFQASYAIGLLFFGWLVDKIGAKLGYIWSIIAWSIAAMAHALSRSTLGFMMARIGLGLGESGNFPTAIKSVTEWFPKKERALATGIFNSGANIGAVLAPILVPWILGIYGWQPAFLITGALGLIWLFFWIFLYQAPNKHKHITQSELEYINSDPDEKEDLDKGGAVSWWRLFRIRQTWAFFFGKFMTDPIWWFFLFWLPDYFSSTFHLDLKKPGWPLVIVYSATTIGSIGGGYLSSYLIKKGWSPYRARKMSMLFFALCVVPVVTARNTDNMWVAVALISLAAAAHQAWSANIYTTASDMFPKKAISSVIGIGGMAGSVGGILFPLLVGNLLEHFKEAGNKNAGYNLIFIICGSAYLIAWVIMHFFVPKMKRVNLP